MGSGKSALVQLLPRLYDVTGGAVEIDGADVRSVDLVSLRSAIAVVNDDPFLFSATVHENIAYARPDATREQVRGGCRRRAGRRLHRAAAEGLRDARRRARADAVRWPAPADRDRAGDPRRSEDPDPRRRDLVGRRIDRAGDQAGARRAAGRSDHVRDRAPAVDDLAGGPDRGAGERPCRGRWLARRAARELGAVPRDRREGDARSGVPDPQAPVEVAGL